MWGLVIAGMIALASLARWNLDLSNRLTRLQAQVAAQDATLRLLTAPDTTIFDLAGEGIYRAASGRVYYNTRTESMTLIVQRLPRLEPDQTYQAWVVVDNKPVSAGLFSVDETGWAMVNVKAPHSEEGYAAIGVTLEPRGGSERPTTIVMQGGF